MEIIGLYVMSM